jgi:hypothetical protein
MTTTLVCPSCERRISLALHIPRERFSLSRTDEAPIDIGKEISLQDILYVHQQLIEENKALRKENVQLYQRIYS